jgi:hypothetical protein
MSFHPACRVLTPNGWTSVSDLRAGLIVLSRGRVKWRENLESSVKPKMIRKVKSVYVVARPTLTLLVSDDGQYPFETGDVVRCSDGAHIYTKKIDIVENTTYLSEVCLTAIELEASPRNLCVNHFMVSL